MASKVGMKVKIEKSLQISLQLTILGVRSLSVKLQQLFKGHSNRRNFIEVLESVQAILLCSVRRIHASRIGLAACQWKGAAAQGRV
jgi:hypothetical protein